jgi:hypothetical protein
MNVVQQLLTLYTLLTSVSELTDSTGMSVSGTLPDPTAQDGPLPGAWLVYGGRNPIDKPKNGVVAQGTMCQNLFVVMIYLDYSLGQDNLINVQLPILEKVVHAIAGQEITGLGGGFRFSFEGERLASINPKRLSYEMRFSIVSSI